MKFTNFKCPNGLPPEECRHIPQLVMNIANYFNKKHQLRQEKAEQASLRNDEQPRRTENSSANKMRTRR